MSLAIFLVVAATLALVFVLRIALSQGLLLSEKGKPGGQIQPVDLEAFRNLTDRAEDEYLRRRLPAGEFRMVQRKRLRAVAAYVQVASRNAAILARLADAALASPDPHTVDAARQLMENAFLLRRNAMIVTFRIYAALVWPTAGFGASPVVSGYARLSGDAMLLGRLQNPAAPVRISAS